MENTRASVQDYFNKYAVEKKPIQEEREVWLDNFNHTDYLDFCISYASACSAPSSIGEDVIRNKYPTTIAELGRKPDDTDEDGLFWYNHLRREGAKWAISRLSERKIVLPSDDDLQKYYEGIKEDDTSLTIYDAMNIKIHWNAAIECIKRLNGIKSQP